MQTKFKVDENLPVEVAELLRQAGYDALTVYDENLAGTRDPQIASVCKEEKRTLVTLDTDFADIGAYPPRDYSGFIVLRLKRQDKHHVKSFQPLGEDDTNRKAGTTVVDCGRESGTSKGIRETIRPAIIHYLVGFQQMLKR